MEHYKRLLIAYLPVSLLIKKFWGLILAPVSNRGEGAGGKKTVLLLVRFISSALFHLYIVHNQFAHKVD